jgi:hypothetical protein
MLQKWCVKIFIYVQIYDFQHFYRNLQYNCVHAQVYVSVTVLYYILYSTSATPILLLYLSNLYRSLLRSTEYQVVYGQGDVRVDPQRRGRNGAAC